MILSTLGLIKFSMHHELKDIRKDIRERIAGHNDDSFKVYQDEFVSPHRRVPTLRKRIKRAGIYQNQQRLLGSMLDQRGVVSNITSNITSELVFSFSPTAEKMFLEKLVDPNHEQRVYANSPAMIWDGEKFVVVMRMWLDKEHTEGKTKNVFSDNYLYTRTYNDKMEALDVSGKILGIPTRVLESIGEKTLKCQ